MVEGALGRVADVVSHRRRAVFLAWLALLAGGAYFSLRQSDRLSPDGWEIPGSASVRASRLAGRFPISSPVFTIFVRGGHHEDVAARIETVRAQLAPDPTLHVGIPQPLGGRAALLPVGYTGRVEDTIDVATRLRHELVETTPRATTRVLGSAAI